MKYLLTCQYLYMITMRFLSVFTEKRVRKGVISIIMFESANRI